MSDLIPLPPLSVGEVANHYAARSAFFDYQQRKAANTLRRQHDDLTLFATYLHQAGMHPTPDALMSTPHAWQGITFGLVAGFVRYLLDAGYAIGSVNTRLSTIKVYCGLAAPSGAIPSDELTLIKQVRGFRHVEGRNIDEERPVSRRGSKKALPISISWQQAEQLKRGQPDTPQGRRDAFLMCLLLDHGLRCGEIAALPTSALNLQAATLTFYRRKVDKMQTHELTRDTLIAATRYLDACTPELYLLMGSRKGGQLQGRMQERSLTDRVRVLASQIGITGASAHDGRHAFVTFAIRGGTDLKSLQDAGGWNSIVMPARYAESHKIANKGVVLGK